KVQLGQDAVGDHASVISVSDLANCGPAGIRRWCCGAERRSRLARRWPGRTGSNYTIYELWRELKRSPCRKTGAKKRKNTEKQLNERIWQEVAYGWRISLSRSCWASRCRGLAKSADCKLASAAA